MDWQFMPLQCMQIALLCSAIVSSFLVLLFLIFKLVLIMHKLFVFVLNYLCRLCFIIICASYARPYVLFISKYAWYICAITFNVVMSYDCMPYMCLTVLYVLSCMFSVTILCLFDRRFKSYLYCYVSSLNKAFERPMISPMLSSSCLL
jgi:hypothetical protein